MMNEEIRLGQCWMVRLTKRDLCVRLESHDPDSGWIARVMTHGRKVRIKSESQLLCRCSRHEIHAVADGTKPNRRSRAVPPPVKPVPEKPLPKKEKLTIEPIQEPLVPLSLLDAAAVVLRESQSALSTREIIALVVQQKLWESTGVTPWATLNAALNRDIAGGTQSRFKKKERGKFTLR